MAPKRWLLPPTLLPTFLPTNLSLSAWVPQLMMWLTIMMHGMTRYDNVGKFGMLGWRRWFACWREKQQPQPEARRQQFAAAAAAAAAKAGGSCSAAHSSGAPMAAEVELGDMESEQHNGGAAAEAAGFGSSAPQAAAAALAPKVAGPSVRGQPVAGDSKSGCGSGKPIADPTGRSWASSNAADVPAPLAPPPAQLVVEQPLRVQLRLHIPKLCLWLVMEGMIVLGIARQVSSLQYSCSTMPGTEAFRHCDTLIADPASAVDNAAERALHACACCPPIAALGPLAYQHGTAPTFSCPPACPLRPRPSTPAVADQPCHHRPELRLPL